MCDEAKEKCGGGQGWSEPRPKDIACPKSFSRPTELPNRFLARLYEKYPFLIPETVEKDPAELAYDKFNANSTYVTSYQLDFCRCQEEEGEKWEVVRARGCFAEGAPEGPRRLPNDRYPAGPRDPVSGEGPTPKVKVYTLEELAKMRKKKVAVAKKLQTEYDANYNDMVRLWKKNNVYNNFPTWLYRVETLPHSE